ncbi:MAG: hypothetical protein E7J63_22515 [Pantoea sp.]|uniref:hypothetical protein n=1 Tax=Pantoea sp. TaxID=69393 RepID=UPI00290A0528|nr:hypothetical protein [Pantoea sp.]MDU7841033.1 hypothetical protein [Pantoea sp.]
MRYDILNISLQILLYTGLKFFAPFALWTPFHLIVGLLLMAVTWIITGGRREPEVTSAEIPSMFFKTGSVCIVLAILAFFFGDKLGAVFLVNESESGTIADLVQTFIFGDKHGASFLGDKPGSENIADIARALCYGLLAIGTGTVMTGYILRQRS